MIDFKEGHVYLFNYRKNAHFQGTFVRYEPVYNTPLFRNIVFCFNRIKDVKFNNYNESNYRCINARKINDTAIGEFDFNIHNYKFYDAEKVKNGQNAINNMEKRALDMILKRLVNEHFEW
jgi:hypothetical protein